MKLTLFTFVAMFALGFQAQAASPRLISHGACGSTYSGLVSDVRFYGNSRGQVSADLTLSDAGGGQINDDGDTGLEAVDFGILPKMHATSTQIIDDVSGKVCATKNGGRRYHSTHQCTIAMRETHRPCSRSYYLVTK